MAKKLYKFSWDCGRMGEVDGLFVAESEDLDKAIGKTIYFGEILGKHSEVYGDLEEGDCEVITDDPQVIKIFEDHNISSGYNPLDYLQEDQV